MGKWMQVSAWVVSAMLAVASRDAAAAIGSVEVVQSVPIETTLAVPGIRMTQQVWVELINAAQSTIDFEEFYINEKAGESLDPVLDAVRGAASRGVQIRFVIDSKFYATYPDEANLLNQVPNIQVRTVDYSSQGGIQHSKYFVVDQSRVFLGSANFDWLALTHIHEVGLSLADAKIASGLESVFATDWNDATPLSGSIRLGMPPRLVSAASWGASQLGYQLFASPPAKTPDGVGDSLSAVTDLLASARSSIKIQVYEYTTKVYQSSARWKDLDSAIRNAAARGVHVQLLVDAVAMKEGRADLKALTNLPNLEVRTVTIPQWSGGPIPYARLVHSKYALVDGASAWVGSENWSKDYFTSSRNVGLILQDSQTTSQLSQIFDRVWSSTYATRL